MSTKKNKNKIKNELNKIIKIRSHNPKSIDLKKTMICFDCQT